MDNVKILEVKQSIFASNDEQAAQLRQSLKEKKIFLLNLMSAPGSGKTTVLITRLGYMTEVCGIAPEAILTMTYTVAATQEMRARFAARFGGVPHHQRCGGAHHRAVQPHVWPYPAGAHPQ